MPDVGDFSDDRELSSVIHTVRLFRTLGADFDRMLANELPAQREIDPHPEFATPVAERGEEEPDSIPAPRERGRPRLPGRWELAAIAFVASGDRSVQSFSHRWSGSGLWRECGFGDWEPDERTVRLRFEEIEDHHWQAFANVANALIANAKAHEPRIGKIVFGDATKWQTPALVKHACTDPTRCEWLNEENHRRRNGGTWRASNVIPRANESDFQALHERESAAPEVESGGEEGDVGITVEWANERGDVVATESAVAPTSIDDRYQRFEFNGHLYKALDKTSGLRKIVKQPGNRVEVWFGGYALSLTDGFTGLRLSTQTFRADEQEYDHIPVAIEEITETLGGAPDVLSLDRFSSIKDMYEYSGRRGIYLVAPYKGTQQRPNIADLRCDIFDEHQIPRCPDCGGDVDITSAGLGRYFDDNDEVRLRGRCLNRDSDECRRKDSFSIPCDIDWRMLTGLPLTSQLSHAVAERHGTFEGVFGHARRRHGFAGKDTTGMLCRRGVPAQRLRGEISRMLDWFRASLRQGWIEGFERRNPQAPLDLMEDHHDRRGRRKRGLGTHSLARLIDERRNSGLNLPYGAVAERLGLVPPSAPPDGGEPPPDAGAPADRG